MAAGRTVASPPFVGVQRIRPFWTSGRLLPANFLNHTPKSPRREGLFSFSWIFVSGGRSSASGCDLGGSTPEGRAPIRYDSVYPTFRPAAQARNGWAGSLR